ncbi:MAG: hypothetical protein HY081_05170 [Gammaproteobacteria bacterium]|nr:hypothetical protein [Gammaproteobacteria bacterium]
MDKVAQVLEASGGLSSEKAETLAIAITDVMAQNWGGSYIYFPKGNWNGNTLRFFQLAERDWAIYREFNGQNRQDVCDRHNISVQHLYRIIADCRRHIASMRALKTNQTPPVPPVNF